MTITPPRDAREVDDASPANDQPRRRRAVPGRPLLIVAVVITIVVAVLVARSVFSAVTPHLYSGTILQQSNPAPAMDGLAFVDGEPVDIAALSGDLVLVYFGYTNCPDVCPTTLSAAANAIDRLPADQREQVRLLMVTVDPDRDRPGELEEYVEFFHPEFDGVTGPVADIDRVASLYGVFYELGDGTVETGYVVDHTATLMAIGPDGTLRIVWPPNVTSQDLHDLSLIHI